MHCTPAMLLAILVVCMALLMSRRRRHVAWLPPPAVGASARQATTEASSSDLAPGEKVMVVDPAGNIRLLDLEKLLARFETDTFLRDHDLVNLWIDGVKGVNLFDHCIRSNTDNTIFAMRHEACKTAPYAKIQIRKHRDNDKKHKFVPPYR